MTINTKMKKYTAIIFAALITAFSGVNSVSAEAASNNTPTETPDEPIVEIISTLDEPTIEAVDSPFKKITDIVPLPKPGDVDDDTFITSADSLLILRASIGVINEYTDRLYSGDVDCDKVITSADSLSILRKSAGFDQVFKNEPLTNVQWFKQGDDYYAKSADGEPIRGLVIIDGYRCGFDKKGKLFTKKAYIGGKKYNFLSSGILPEGWQYSSEGKSFYSDGEKLTGLNEIYGLTYYLVNGIAVKGWQTINGLRMYFGDNGAASVGWKTIGGKMFYFDRDYCVKEGLQSIAGDKYYLFSDGDFAKGFKTVDGKRFYFGADGKAAQGLTKIDGNTYYFDYNNIMQTGWQVIDGIRYYLTDKGYAATGEYVIDGLEYHFTDEGKFFTGLQNIFGKTYYFDDFGFSQCGWQTTDDGTYYFNSDGTGAESYQKIDGQWYYFENGKMEEDPLSKNLVVYSQRDDRWASHPYGNYNASGTESATIRSSGCGILSFVNSVNYLTGNFIEPTMLADWSVSHGHRINGMGTAFSLYSAFAGSHGAEYGFKYVGQTSNYETLKKHLLSGGTAVGSAPNHLMAVVNYNPVTNQFLILDSASSEKRHTQDTGYTWQTVEGINSTPKLKFSVFMLFSKAGE